MAEPVWLENSGLILTGFYLAQGKLRPTRQARWAASDIRTSSERLAAPILVMTLAR